MVNGEGYLIHGEITGFSAIIVTGGITSPTRGVADDISRSAQVLREDGSLLCSLPDLPDSRVDHTQSGLITCGGYSSTKSCLMFESGQWRQAWSLMAARLYHSAWHTNTSVILLGGTYMGRTSESLQYNGESLETFPLNYDTESVFVFVDHVASQSKLSLGRLVQLSFPMFSSSPEERTLAPKCQCTTWAMIPLDICLTFQIYKWAVLTMAVVTTSMERAEKSSICCVCKFFMKSCVRFYLSLEATVTMDMAMT